MTEVTYPPLDQPKPVADQVWIVDSGPIHAMGIPLPVRMTVVRLADGKLLLHSPTPFSFPLKAELEGLGTIGHLVAPNIAHWMYMEEWQSHCPDARAWAAPGLRERGAVARSKLRINHVLSDQAPADWAEEIAQVVVPGAGKFHEVAMFHKPSRTLLLTDLIVNLEPEKLPRLAGIGARVLGAAEPSGKAPVYLRLAVSARREEAARAARRLIDFEPERVIFAHGQWFETDGTARLRAAFDWLIK
jgi:hypothetical protein